MKALIFHGPGQMTYEDVPQPRIGRKDVLMRVRAVGICGTDLHIYRGGLPVAPHSIIGHEFSGTVAAMGTDVHHVHVGDPIVAEHVVNCGTCPYCKTGKSNLCPYAQIIGVQRPGALAQYIGLPASMVYKLPDTISFEEGALIEPLSIALYAVREAGFLLDKRVAVVGQGPIGLLVDQVLTAAGALVTGIDIRPDTLAFAKQKGWIRHAIRTGKGSVPNRVLKLTPDGYDIVFEAVGNEVTAQMSLDITRRNGSVYLLGVFGSPAQLNLMQLVKKELKVFGSWTCANAFQDTIELVSRKKIDLKSLITHRFPLRDAARAFSDAGSYKGRRLKTVIMV